MSNVYVHFSQISLPARYSVVNFQLESHSLRFREVIFVFVTGLIILDFPGFYNQEKMGESVFLYIYA